MATFGQSFKRELGKNTGKWVSNKIFGDGHATPHKLIHARDKAQARQEREEARAYKEQQRQIEQNRRERERAMRQHEKDMAERQKQEMIRANEYEVNEHNNYINVIQSVHKDYSKPMNWEEILNCQEIKYVETAEELKSYYKQFTNEQVEQRIIEAKKQYKLSLLRFVIGKMYVEKNKWLFKIVSKKEFLAIFGLLCFILLCYSASLSGFMAGFVAIISVLLFIIALVFKGGANDFEKQIQLQSEINYLEGNKENWYNEYLNEQDKAHKQYLKEKEDLLKFKAIAKGVTSNDTQSYTYALNQFNPFEDLREYGSDISFQSKDGYILVDFFVHGEEVIPKTTKRILRKGLEVKEDPIPQSRFNEIYQDYVCSCVLRIAKEVFQLLPVGVCTVNAKANLINTSTGNFESQTIVSVRIERNKLDILNFDLLDPSDSMSNFEHNMIFNKNDGFLPVTELV